MKASIAITWLPVLAIPLAVIGIAPADWPRWLFMWSLAFAIYAGCKWLTWRAATTPAPLWKHLGYLLLWPGLDATTFLGNAQPSAPSWFACGFAISKLVLGAILIALVFPALPIEWELLRGWIGIIGFVFVLHFGVFHLLSLMWRSLGVNAKPIMGWPLLAESVSEFWGKGWNTAFRDLTHKFLFRPMTAWFGARAALIVGFFFSGVLHDLVISVPAKGGYGGPTVFFLIQAGGVFIERTALGRRIGLGGGWRGWAFTMLILVSPVMLLFHDPFVRNVVVPFFDFVGELSSLTLQALRSYP